MNPLQAAASDFQLQAKRPHVNHVARALIPDASFQLLQVQQSEKQGNQARKSFTKCHGQPCSG